MSDIGGTGYGSNHDWERGATAQVGSNYWAKGTVFTCKDCGVSFVHKYDLISDIFEAMKQERVPEKCSKNDELKEVKK